MIISLKQNDFKAACARLAGMVVDAGTTPDVIIGIASGGDFVAQNVIAAMAVLNPGKKIKVCSVKLQRHGSTTKKRFLPSLLKHCPRVICDFMRRAERFVYAVKDYFCVPKLSDLEIPDDVKKIISRDCRSILIVDDAVDSGTTMKSVYNAVSNVVPHAVVKTAALTCTRAKSLIYPDFLLYNPKTIIRFPWAPDA